MIGGGESGPGARPMDPRLYEALKTRIHSLSDLAVRVSIPPDEHATTMKHRILRVADERPFPSLSAAELEALFFGARQGRILSKPKK